jgi:hypothetical protein
LQQLVEVRIPRFDTNAAFAQRIRDAFMQAGAPHMGEWDGTLGSAVLGLQEKRAIFEQWRADGNPAAVVLSAMKLLDRNNMVRHTETRLRHVCAQVFGLLAILQEQRIWLEAVQTLTEAQFVSVEKDELTPELDLVIRKDTYFDKVIVDNLDDSGSPLIE